MSSREGRVRLRGTEALPLALCILFIYCAVTGIRNPVFSPIILQLPADKHEILGEPCLSVILDLFTQQMSPASLIDGAHSGSLRLILLVNVSLTAEGWG